MTTLILATALSLHRPEPVGYADMVIEKVRADAHGLDVDFSTSRPPPYCVAVFPMHQWAFPYRSYPYAAVVTEQGHARVDGNFLVRDNVFVQVFDAGITNGWDHTAWRAVGVPTGMYVYLDPEKPWLGRREITNTVHKATIERVPFDPASSPAERRARQLANSGDFRRPVLRPVKDFDPTDGEWMSQAFYEGRSNAWPVRRKVVAMTSSEGREIAVDWDGHIGYTSVTNAPVGVIKPVRRERK